MTKAFEFQVMRIADGGGKLIPVSDPVVIRGVCEEQAQVAAAKEKLGKTHKKPSSYHDFLVTQADPSICYVNKYMPYLWWVIEGKTVW